jgi:hypothetical protein
VVIIQSLRVLDRGVVPERRAVGLSPSQKGNFYLLSQEPQTTVVHNATDGIKVSEWLLSLSCFLDQQKLGGLGNQDLRVLQMAAYRLHPIEMFVEARLETVCAC